MIKLNPTKIFIISKTVSRIGTSLRLIVWPLYAFTLTLDPKIPVLMLIANSVGSTIGGLFSGYIADKFNRKKVIIIDDLICGVFTIIIPFLSKETILYAIPISLIWTPIEQKNLSV